MIAKGNPRTLGTALRRLVELLDGEVEHAYREAGLNYRPSYTPVIRALMAAESLSVRELAKSSGVSHAAASATVAQMRRRGLLESADSADGRERRVRLSATARELLPRLHAVWLRTERAEEALTAELDFDLGDAVNAAINLVERRSFLAAPQPDEPSELRRPCCSTK